ncbi:hypothetical protein ACFSTC_62315 [Nonomuraea ferruginea]
MVQLTIESTIEPDWSTTTIRRAGGGAAGGVPVEELVDIQPLVLGVPVGEVLPDRPVQVEVAEDPLGRHRTVDGAYARLLHLGAEHLGDLVHEPADQRLGVGQRHPRQVGLVAQQLLDQRHAGRELPGQRGVGEHLAQPHPAHQVAFQPGEHPAQLALPRLGAQLAGLAAERLLEPARVLLPGGQPGGGDVARAGREQVEQQLGGERRGTGAVTVVVARHEAAELGAQLGKALHQVVHGHGRVEQLG